MRYKVNGEGASLLPPSNDGRRIAIKMKGGMASVPSIAEKFGVSEFAVKAYAQRNGWRRLVRAKQIRRQTPPSPRPVPRAVKEPDWSAFWRQDQPGPLKRRPPAFRPDYGTNRMVANQ